MFAGSGRGAVGNVIIGQTYPTHPKEAKPLLPPAGGGKIFQGVTLADARVGLLQAPLALRPSRREGKIQIRAARQLRSLRIPDAGKRFLQSIYCAILVAILGLFGFTSRVRVPGIMIRSISSMGMAPRRTGLPPIAQSQHKIQILLHDYRIRMPLPQAFKKIRQRRP